MARKKPNAKKGKPNPNPAPAAASNIAGAGSSTQAAEPEVVREEPPLLQLAIVASPAFWAAAGAEACPAQLEELADGKAAAPSSSCGAGLVRAELWLAVRVFFFLMGRRMWKQKHPSTHSSGGRFQMALTGPCHLFTRPVPATTGHAHAHNDVGTCRTPS